MTEQFRDLHEAFPKIPKGQFARSSRMENLSSESVEQLASMGFRSVIDLRKPEEVSLHPSGYYGFSCFRYMNIPLLPEKYAVKSETTMRGQVYYDSLLRYAEYATAVFEALSAQEKGIIFHCAGGKSRSGVISALLLNLYGAGIDCIAEDYCRSYLTLYGYTSSDPKVLLGRKDIIAFMQLIIQKHGDAHGFLQYLGVPSDVIHRLSFPVL